MLFAMDQSEDLLTPTINDGGVNNLNPTLTSSDIFSLDDIGIYLSSISSKKNDYQLPTKDNLNESSYNNTQQHDDFYSSFDFPVFDEFDKTDLTLDDLQIDKYITQSSFPSPPVDSQKSSLCNDSIKIDNEDSSSSTFPWVGEECKIETVDAEDMMVPISPPLSISSLSSSTSSKKSGKKSSLSTIDRKLRKKGQNKTAAEKYRIKKKSERDEIYTRHSDLKNQNRELKFELDNLTFRLEQFKQLFVDVLQIKIPSE